MKYLFILVFFCSCYTTTFYVVRHAEKQLVPANASDPALTDIGVQRANDLNAYFGNKKPDSIFVSKYLRTRQTAAPTAAAATITPVVVNQTDTNGIDAFVNRIYNMKKKKVLIVGHSNTVPRIVKGLSGQTINPIPETDYDNMYIIKIKRSSRQLTQTNYGAINKSFSIIIGTAIRYYSGTSPTHKNLHRGSRCYPCYGSTVYLFSTFTDC